MKLISFLCYMGIISFLCYLLLCHSVHNHEYDETTQYETDTSSLRTKVTYQTKKCKCPSPFVFLGTVQLFFGNFSVFLKGPLSFLTFLEIAVLSPKAAFLQCEIFQNFHKSSLLALLEAFAILKP